MTPKKFVSALDKVRQSCADELQVKVDAVCKEYGLTFNSGMGYWSFDFPNGQTICKSFQDIVTPKKVWRVVCLLRTFDSIPESDAGREITNYLRPYPHK